MSGGKILLYIVAFIFGTIAGATGLSMMNSGSGFSGFIVAMLGGLAEAYIVSDIAANKGRSSFGWGVFGFFIFPIALIAVLIVGKTQEFERSEMEHSDKYKKCPFCAEMILREAKVCRYCGRELPEETPEERKAREQQELVDRLIGKK